MHKNHKGIFICVEGPNGAGKTTFIAELYNILKKNYNVFLTKEPTNTDFGILCKNAEGTLDELLYTYLICADRCNHIKNEILPHIKKNEIVISDRYIASSLVYQNFNGVPTDIVWDLNKHFLVPEINIFIFANKEILADRLSKRSYFSTIEKIMTREEELKRYIQAKNFLSKKGYNCLTYYNNESDDLDKNVSHVYNIINKFIEVTK